MRKKTTNAFLDLSLSETETYALLNAVAVVLADEQGKAKDEQERSHLHFEDFARALYIRSLSGVFTAIKGAVEDEDSTE